MPRNSALAIRCPDQEPIWVILRVRIRAPLSARAGAFQILAYLTPVSTVRLEPASSPPREALIDSGVLPSRRAAGTALSTQGRPAREESSATRLPRAGKPEAVRPGGCPG